MIYNFLLFVLVVAFLAIMYVFIGMPRLWGPWKGTPFCGHPFELTWGLDPRPTEWQCPKCLTEFEVVEDQGWMPKRKR